MAEQLYMPFDNYGKDGKSVQRVPKHSRLHPMIPRQYTMEWRQDMKNRSHIIENAKLGNIPHYEHDDSLFLEKREQMHYNVEDRARIEAKYQMPPRSKLLRPDFHHHTSRYQSELMARRDDFDTQKQMAGQYYSGQS